MALNFSDIKRGLFKLILESWIRSFYQQKFCGYALIVHGSLMKRGVSQITNRIYQRSAKYQGLYVVDSTSPRSNVQKCVVYRPTLIYVFYANAEKLRMPCVFFCNCN